MFRKTFSPFWLLALLLVLPQADAKTFLILNASSELGTNIAKDLSSPDVQFLLTARNLKKLDSLSNPKNKLITLDFSSASYKDLGEKLKGVEVDGVVVITPRPVLGSHYLPNPEAWEKCFRNCFIGPLEALRVAIPHIKSGGKIVVIGGLTSVSALDLHQHYAVLRMMWLAQAKGLSRVLAKDKIHVNTIALGGTMTESFAAKMGQRAKNNNRTYEEQYAVEVDNIPLKQYAEPAQVSQIVKFLLSPASNHITGVNIPVDGGFHRSY